MGKPPAMPGRLPEFDNSGNIRKSPKQVIRSKFTNLRRLSMKDYRSLWHTTWDCMHPYSGLEETSLVKAPGPVDIMYNGGQR